MDFSRIISSFQSITRDLYYVNNSRDSKLNKLALSVILLIGTLTTAYTFKKLKNSRFKKLTIPLGLSITAIVARKLLHKQAIEALAISLQSARRMSVDKRKYLATRAAAVRLQSAVRRFNVIESLKLEKVKDKNITTLRIYNEARVKPDSFDSLAIAGVPLSTVYEMFEKTLESTVGANGSLMQDHSNKIVKEEIKRNLEDKLNNQLAIIIRSCSNVEIKTVLQKLQDTNSVFDKSEWIQSVRKLCSNGELNTTENNVLDKICEVIFSCELHSALAERLALFAPNYNANPEPLTLENFANRIQKARDEIDKQPPHTKTTSGGFHKYSGAVGSQNFLDKDEPSKRCTQLFEKSPGEIKSIDYLRHPSPHIGGNLFLATAYGSSRTVFGSKRGAGTPEEIDPVFKRMLSSMQKKEEGYLYQCHQRLGDEGKYLGFENEDTRCQSLKKLEDECANFHLVFQSFESPLFKKEEDFECLNSFSELKKSLIHSFINGTNGNLLPKHIRDSENLRSYIKRMETIFDYAHNGLFKGKEKCDSIKEWQTCIMQFYIWLGDDLKFYLPNITCGSTPCKNFYDRGGARAICEDVLHLVMTGKPITDQQLKEIAANFLPVPILSKGIAPLKDRLAPACAFVSHLATLDKEQLKVLQSFDFYGFKFSENQINKQFGQTLLPSLNTIESSKLPSILQKINGQPFSIVNPRLPDNNNRTFGSAGDLLVQLGKDIPRQCITVVSEGKRKTFMTQKNFSEQSAQVNQGECIIVKGKDNSSNGYKLLKHLEKTFKLPEMTAIKIAAQIPQNTLVESITPLKSAIETEENKFIQDATSHETTVEKNGKEIIISHNKIFKYINLEKSSADNEACIATIPIKLIITCAVTEQGEPEEWKGRIEWSLNISPRAGSGDPGSSYGHSPLVGEKQEGQLRLDDPEVTTHPPGSIAIQENVVSRSSSLASSVVLVDPVSG